MRIGLILCLEDLDTNFAPLFGRMNFGLLNVRNRPLVLHSIEFLIENKIDKLCIIINSNAKEYIALLHNTTNIDYEIKQLKQSSDNLIEDIFLNINEDEIIITDVRAFSYKSFDNAQSNKCVKYPCYLQKDQLKAISKIDDIHQYSHPFDDVSLSFNHLYIGTIDDYYHAQRLLISGRFFNSFKCNFLDNTLRKESSHQKTLRNEILWYINLPRQLQSFIPKIIDYSVTDNIFVDIEYCSFPLLADIFVYGNWSIDVWQSILNRLFAIHERFCSFTTHIAQESYTKIYTDKLDERILSLNESNSRIAELLKNEVLVINGQEFQGWPRLKNKVLRLSKEIYDGKGSIIHGDFFLSNIFFDPSSGIVKLIDPRGEWDRVGIYGDPKYDIAKLRHSISGKFDFIIRDMFELTVDDHNIDYKFKYVDHDLQVKLPEMFDNMIASRYNVMHIKFIEALLFISMLPLHSDSYSRQVIQFATGIQQLNEIL